MKHLVGTILGLLLLVSSAAQAQEQRYAASARGEKFIALTFDDGPDEETTPVLLDVLKQYDAKATFFVMGSRIRANASILTRMVNEGHAIGNHTMTHTRLNNLSTDALRSEIEGANQLIKITSGISPDLLRPPFGATDPAVENVARANGLAILLWSIYPDDSSYFSSAASIAGRIVSSAKDGDIVFLHDTSQRSVEVTELALRSLSQKGFRFVTASELIKRHGKLVPGATYKSGNVAE